MDTYPFTNEQMLKIPCYNDCVETYKITYMLTNTDLDEAMNAGWVILSSWIEPDDMSRDVETYLTNISFRIAKKNVRMLLVACLDITLPSQTIMNVDADNPGETLGYTPSTSNELWKLRMASIAGYGPCGNVGPGLKPPMKPPKLLVVGLDIEVSTHARNGEMTLPHDDILSITISNGGWYTNEFKDICICMYTNGYVRETTWENGRKPLIVKVKSGGHAVEMAYKVLKSINPDFVTIHNGFNYDLRYMAASCANMEGITDTFDERRLGNVGVGVFWRLPYGIMCVDTMYYAHKMENKVWNSFSLAYMSNRYDLPPKLDTDTMQIDTSKENDMTNMITYNCRDSDLHAWLAMRMRLCERVCVLAGLSRSTIWDSIANNAGKMVYCLEQSEAMSMDMWVDLSTKTGSDADYFEGGYVLEPRPGCYKGVIVIDGNSLYGSIMVEMGIFVDRCISASSLEELIEKANMDVDVSAYEIEVDDLIELPGMVVMRSANKYLGVMSGGPTLLSGILKSLISMRKEYKANGDEVTAGCCKVLTTSAFGVFGSKHGDISSKTCAEIITFAARFYLRMMISVARSCGYNVIYGDTDSIFVEVKGEDEKSCMDRGEVVKQKIVERVKGTVFENVGADIKGNYMSIVITSKKKYEAVMWCGEVETKGLAPVKKDTLPIVKYVMSRVLSVLNGSGTKMEKNEKLIDILSSVMNALNKNKLPASSQVIEKRINGQPHYVYVDNFENEQAVLVDIGVKVINVSKRWVVGRIKMAINRVLTCLDMNTFDELLFAYRMRKSMSGRRTTA